MFKSLTNHRWKLLRKPQGSTPAFTFLGLSLKLCPIPFLLLFLLHNFDFTNSLQFLTIEERPRVRSLSPEPNKRAEPVTVLDGLLDTPRDGSIIRWRSMWWLSDTNSYESYKRLSKSHMSKASSWNPNVFFMGICKILFVFSGKRRRIYWQIWSVSKYREIVNCHGLLIVGLDTILGFRSCPLKAELKMRILGIGLSFWVPWKTRELA